MTTRIITLHNISGLDKIYIGQTITDGETYNVFVGDLTAFQSSAALFADVGLGLVLIGNGTADFTDATAGWQWLLADTGLPFSDVDESQSKLSVHPSYKPMITDGVTYAVWTGAGDDVNADPNLSVLGGGELLHFDMKVADDVVTKDVKFDHTAFGRVWIHEAYLKFEDGGENNYVSSDIMATGAVVQPSVNLDLILDGDYVKPAPGGPGTGTHGWAASPTIIPRTFSMDGAWDFDGVNLTPNLDDTGGYNISTVDMSVHRYVNKIPTYGTCPYFSMSSDETAEINPGYYIRINVHNVSNNDWHLSVIMEIYRERTVDP